MILGAAYRSISLKEEGILVGQGKVITMEDAHRAGLGEIFDRVVVELVGKMEEMKMVSFVFQFLCSVSGKRYNNISGKNPKKLPVKQNNLQCCANRYKIIPELRNGLGEIFDRVVLELVGKMEET